MAGDRRTDHRRPGASPRARAEPDWPDPAALVGLAGSFLGGLVARYAIGLHYRYSLLTGFILAVIFAAIIVAAIDRRPSWRR